MLGALMTTESATTPFAQPGTVLAEKYRILEPVCDGAVASVFRAQHLVLGEPVLLRVMRPELHRTSGEARRFVDSAKALMRLADERVARVIDVGLLDDGLPFVALETLPGRTLKQEMQRRGPLPFDDALALLAQLGRAIEVVRAAGIQRDEVDPADVFVAPEPGALRVYLIGVGLAENGTCDARSDVFELASTMFRMLTGRTPGTADTLPAEAQGDDASDIIDERIAAVLRRARDPEPARRQGSIAELMSALGPPAPKGAAKTLVQGSVLSLPAAGAQPVGRTLESEGVPPTPVTVEPLVQVEGSVTGRPTLLSADAAAPPSSTVPEAPAVVSRSVTVPQGPFVSVPPKPTSQTMPQEPSLTEPGSTAATLREGMAPPQEAQWWRGRGPAIGFVLLAALFTALAVWALSDGDEDASEEDRVPVVTSQPPKPSPSEGPAPLVREPVGEPVPEPAPEATPPAPVPRPPPPRPVPRPVPRPRPPAHDVFL